jgi:hypothetical protein
MAAGQKEPRLGLLANHPAERMVKKAI